MRPLGPVLRMWHDDLAREVFRSGNSLEVVIAAHREACNLGGRAFGALGHGPIPNYRHGSDGKIATACPVPHAIA
jgi:hypothetical protein